MRRTLTVAVVGAALAGSGAFAQTTTAPNANTNAPAATGPATNTAAPRTPDANRAMFQMRQGQWRSSKLIGLNVYNNNNEDIGEINELIVGNDGKIAAVVIGVGGFLGLGEHDAAVPYEQVRFMEEPRRADTTASTANQPTRNTGTVAPGNAPAANNSAANTAGTMGAPSQQAAPRSNTQTAMSGDSYRGYPDHAVVNMTKEQLQALPQVRYAR